MHECTNAWMILQCLMRVSVFVLQKKSMIQVCEFARKKNWKYENESIILRENLALLSLVSRYTGGTVMTSFNPICYNWTIQLTRLLAIILCENKSADIDTDKQQIRKLIKPHRKIVTPLHSFSFFFQNYKRLICACGSSVVLRTGLLIHNHTRAVVQSNTGG